MNDELILALILAALFFLAGLTLGYESGLLDQRVLYMTHDDLKSSLESSTLGR